jgi:tripartite-type tricarboxylate transporter receptor subunit TctC
MPDAIANKVSNAVAAAVQTPAVRKLFIDRNVEPYGSTPQELQRLIDSEIEQWGPVIKKANITV